MFEKKIIMDRINIDSESKLVMILIDDNNNENERYENIIIDNHNVDKCVNNINEQDNPFLHHCDDDDDYDDYCYNFWWNVNEIAKWIWNNWFERLNVI